MLNCFCDEITEYDLTQSINYQNLVGISYKKNLAALLLHVFLHQVHHRGQVTTLLSQLGIDFGDTDLPEFIVDENTSIESTKI